MDSGNLYVLEVGDVRTAMAGRLFRDLGFEVVRIEPRDGQSSRFGPFTPDGQSLYHAFYNRGKEILRPASPMDAVAKYVAARPDRRPIIVVAPEDFPMDDAPRGDVLSAGHREAVVVELLDFGSYRGPRRYANASIAARGGQMYICGAADGPPLAAPGHQPVSLAGMYAVIASLSMALRAPQGSRLARISLQACVASAIENAFIAYFCESRVQRRQGTFHWSRNSFVGRTRDGYVLVELLLDWNALIAWLAEDGMEGDLANPKYADPVVRRAHDYIFHIAETMAPWLAKRTTAEVLVGARLRRFPWSDIASMRDTVRSRHLADRGFIWHDADRSGPEIASPFRWGDANVKGGTRAGMADRRTDRPTQEDAR